MAKNTQMSDAALAIEANALAAAAANGLIKVYDGTQPANGNTAVGAQTLGVTLTLGATAFATTTNGVLTANAITGAAAVAGITPTWFRVFKSDGTTVLFDGTVGSGGTYNLVLSAAAFTIGTTVNCSSFTHTIPASGTGV